MVILVLDSYDRTGFFFFKEYLSVARPNKFVVLFHGLGFCAPEELFQCLCRVFIYIYPFLFQGKTLLDPHVPGASLGESD